MTRVSTKSQTEPEPKQCKAKQVKKKREKKRKKKDANQEKEKKTNEGVSSQHILLATRQRNLVHPFEHQGNKHMCVCKVPEGVCAQCVVVMVRAAAVDEFDACRRRELERWTC